MNRLQTAATYFKQFFRKEYEIKAGHRGKLLEVKLIFKSENFHHLIGLHKLTDLPQISRARKSFQDIDRGKITYADIMASHSISIVNDRLAVFTHIDNILSGKIIIRFDPRKAYTSIPADILMYEQVNNAYIHLLFSRTEHMPVYIPCSFFPRTDTKFIERQEQYKVLDLKVNSI